MLQTDGDTNVVSLVEEEKGKDNNLEFEKKLKIITDGYCALIVIPIVENKILPFNIFQFKRKVYLEPVSPPPRLS